MKRYKIHVQSKSIQEVQNDCKKWAEEIAETYIPDLIVFVAKSGYLFAEPMAEVFKCNMVDIIASRPASKKKDKIKKLIELIPEKMLMKILSLSFMYKFHDMKTERNIQLTNSFVQEKNNNHKNILIVDDSVDTGWTVKKVIEKVKEEYNTSNIKLASYSVIDYSKDRVNVDFWRYRNEIILTATSRKSKEYDKFIEQYLKWTDKYK